MGLSVFIALYMFSSWYIQVVVVMNYISRVPFDADNGAQSSGKMLGVSFYITSQSGRPGDLDSRIKASIENDVLLEVLESLGSLRNCSLRGDVSADLFFDEWVPGILLYSYVTVVKVSIVGLNNGVDLSPDLVSSDQFAFCNAHLQSHHQAWGRLFSKESYGVWLIIVTASHSFLFLALLVLVAAPHYSCLVYGMIIEMQHI